ncbi:MAG: PepSY domain-containing protein [Merdibacter sp.]
MKRMKKHALFSAAILLISAALLGGCTGQIGNKESGTLILSVNPEIEINYDSQGNVTSVQGVNDDGKEIVEGYLGYEGKDCETVLDDLIRKINEAGYFSDTVDGNQKNIVLQLAAGSLIPEDDFLENISGSTRKVIDRLSLTNKILTVDEDDHDPDYAKDGKPSPYISLAKAKEIALAQANVKASDAVFEDKEFDHDDGKAVFELEFKANGYEYEYDIDAVSGKVIRAEHDKEEVKKADNSGTGTVSSSNSGLSGNRSDYNDTNYGSSQVTDDKDSGYGSVNKAESNYNDQNSNYGFDDSDDNNKTDYDDDHDDDDDQDDDKDDGNTDYD